jgi:hypothetical protein
MHTTFTSLLDLEGAELLADQLPDDIILLLDHLGLPLKISAPLFGNC